MVSKIVYVMMLVGSILTIVFIDRSFPLWFIGIICSLVGSVICIREGNKLKKSRKKEDNEETKDW